MTNELKILRDIVSGKPAPFQKLFYTTGERWKDGKPRFAVVVLYRENFEEFSEDQKITISLWVSEIIKLARAAGVATYLEVEGNVPRA